MQQIPFYIAIFLVKKLGKDIYVKIFDLCNEILYFSGNEIC